MGDGIIATMDTYNQMIYAIGKGPTSTTVTAPDIGVQPGTSVTIKGKVMDVSPGTIDDPIKLRFPNGVPAVSDDSISDWMLYVYKQFARPTNATGVEVTISVLDSNGNYRNIGTTTSSADGFFSYSWMPDITGEYKVYASFAGSAAYYGSHAESAFTVDEAPEPTAAPTQPPASVVEQYFIPSVVAIILVIILIGVVLMLMVRKRP